MIDAPGGQIKAVLFDKDGTLFDFRKTWEPWAAKVLSELAEGDEALLSALADALRFDLAESRFHPDSFVIAGTNTEVAEALAQVLTDQTVADLEETLIARAQTAPLVSVTDLPEFLGRLRKAGLKLGVMTNDSHAAAMAHLQSAGVTALMDMIIGSDSGFGAKPDPDPLLAFSREVGIDPSHTVMVGDSTHDLLAGRAAGMRTLGVLTGPARTGDLAPHADVVMDDISGMIAWLGLTA